MQIDISIFLISLLIYNANSSCLVGSKQLDDQCSTYCYQVVKPLLQYVNTVKSMTQEHNELQQTIKVQAEVIRNLNDLIKSKDVQLTNQQILISNLNASHESQNQIQQKLINQYEMQVSNLKSEISSKDEEIKKLQYENENIKELQNEITANQQKSSCVGKVTGLHAIRVPIYQTMTVPCDSNLAATEAGPGWIVIQRRMDGSVNFNRTWAEYKEGFGDMGGEFFLGLEKIHLLTQSQPHELYIYLMDFSNQTRYARYNNFVIGNEEEFYEMKELGTYSGNSGNSLVIHINKKFSTADRYEHTSNNCAKNYGSGWWFINCYRCNLNGEYAFSNTDKDIDSVEWRDWKLQPMKFTQMMIRPIRKKN